MLIALDDCLLHVLGNWTVGYMSASTFSSFHRTQAWSWSLVLFRYIGFDLPLYQSTVGAQNVFSSPKWQQSSNATSFRHNTHVYRRAYCTDRTVKPVGRVLHSFQFAPKDPTKRPEVQSELYLNIRHICQRQSSNPTSRNTRFWKADPSEDCVALILPLASRIKLFLRLLIFVRSMTALRGATICSNRISKHFLFHSPSTMMRLASLIAHGRNSFVLARVYLSQSPIRLYIRKYGRLKVE